MQPPAAASCLGSTEHSSCTLTRVGSIALAQRLQFCQQSDVQAVGLMQQPCALAVLTNACTSPQVGSANMTTRIILWWQ